MKKILFILLTFGTLFAQGNIATRPVLHASKWLFGNPADYAVLGANGDGIDTTLAFSIKGWQGATNIFFDGDTTDADSAITAANNSDSCLVIGLQLYDIDLGWAKFYSSTATGYTVLDTINRAYVNAAGSTVLYFPLALEDSWAPADSARFILKIGVGDTLPFRLKVGEGAY